MQWLYWQGVAIAPLMGLMVYLGTPSEPVNRALLRDADWGGMLLLGTAVSMIYAGLDQDTSKAASPGRWLVPWILA